MIRSYLYFLIILSFFHCNKPSSDSFDIDNVAANDEVANYMKAFEGRGALSDNSTPTSPEIALENFEIPEDLSIGIGAF